MYNYNYKLKYGSEVYKCTHNVTGFEDEGIKFGKASENKGVIKSYASEIQLIGLDCDWIKNIYLTKGFNEKVQFQVFKNDFLKGETLEYSAFIDMSTVSINVNRCTFSLKQGGFITYLDNIRTKEVTLGNNSGFTNVNYSGNKYTTEIDIISKSTINTELSTDEIKYIIPTSIKENNNNIEDIRMFAGATETELSKGAKITDSNCFIKVLEQKYIETLKFNLNIDKFIFKNFGAVQVPSLAQVANIRYRFSLHAFNNVKENWDIDDETLIYSDEYNVYAKYSLEYMINEVGQVRQVIGTLINGNPYYIFQSDVSQYLSGSESDNIKFVICVTPIILELIYNNNPVYIVNNYGNLELTTNIDIKCFVKNFQLVPEKSINSWRVETVYNYIVNNINNRPSYNVVYDLSALQQSNLYLTSASELCGDTKLTTTLDQLLQFIYLATGLRHIVNEINGVYYVSFEKYENSFKEIEIAKIENSTDAIIECEPDKIFTDVEVGWDNKDTGIFKSFEYNTINKFRTGNNNIESNTLSLNCAYSASVTDLETIAYNSGYNDKSYDAKDIFIIECWNDNGVIRNLQYSGSGSIAICGNVSLTPRRLLNIHRFELSDFLYHNNVLTYNSTNGLADIVINGVRENETIYFNDQIMQPFILDFEGVINQSVIKVDNNKYGYFTFIYNGSFIRGWIAEGTDSVTVAANGNVSKLRLIVKKSTKL